MYHIRSFQSRMNIRGMHHKLIATFKIHSFYLYGIYTQHQLLIT